MTLVCVLSRLNFQLTEKDIHGAKDTPEIQGEQFFFYDTGFKTNSSLKQILDLKGIIFPSFSTHFSVVVCTVFCLSVILLFIKSRLNDQQIEIELELLKHEK